MKNTCLVIIFLLCSCYTFSQGTNNQGSSKSNGAGFQQNNPLTGIEVVVKRRPEGSALNLGKTDVSGNVTGTLAAGTYELDLRGIGLKGAAVLIKFTPVKGKETIEKINIINIAQLVTFKVIAQSTVTINVSEPE